MAQAKLKLEPQHHLFGFLENLDAAAALNRLTPIPEGGFANLFEIVDTDYLRVPSTFSSIVGAYISADATVQPRARLVQTSYKTIFSGRTSIEVPLLSPTIEPGSPPVFNDWREDPSPLIHGDLLSCELLQNPGAATDEVALLWAANGPIKPVSPKGGHWLRTLTTAAALTANQWNNRSVTFEEEIGPGEYEILGLRGISTSLIGIRIAFPNHTWRPGVLGCDARGDLVHPAFQPGQMGGFGSFKTTQRPTFDLLGDAADNEAQPIDLYIRRIGDL